MLKFFIMSISNILKKLNRRDTKFLPKFSKKSKFILLFFVFISLGFLVNNIFAVDNLVKDTQDAQIKKNNAESWQENAWNTTAVNALTTLTGKIPFNADGSFNPTGYVPGGVIGAANGMVASLYQPQSSGIEYIAQVKDNFLGKQSYAQGVSIGNNGKSLQPLLPAWKGFRNVVYTLFSIVFVIIGIMIMLRIKISPQAVITIQAAIPKLITSLIMVTFSYAIAGLIIDLSYLIQGIAISFFFQIKGIPLGNELLGSRWLDWGIGTSFSQLNNSSFEKVIGLTQASVPFKSTIGLVTTLGALALGTLLGGFLTQFLGPASIILRGLGEGVGAILGAVGGVVILIVIGLLIAFWLIKLWFGLLKTYILILVQIVTAPFIIGMGAFPNSKIGFSSWLTQLVSKVAVFPVTLVAIIFIHYLVDMSDTCKLWNPKLIEIAVTQWCGGGMLGSAIGLAGLAMLAKLPKLVPEAIFQIKPSPFGVAIGEGFKQVSGKAVGLGKLGGQAGGQAVYDKVETAKMAGNKPTRSTRIAKVFTDFGSSMGLIKSPK